MTTDTSFPRSALSRRAVLADAFRASLLAIAAASAVTLAAPGARAETHEEGGGGKGRGGSGGAGGHDDGGHDEGGDEGGHDDGGHEDGGSGKGRGASGRRSGRDSEGAVSRGRGHSIEDRVFRWPAG